MILWFYDLPWEDTLYVTFQSKLGARQRVLNIKPLGNLTSLLIDYVINIFLSLGIKGL